MRGLHIERPFQVLSGDIASIRTKEGFASLCRVKNMASGKVLASKVSERMKAEVLLDTVRKTVRNRHLPEGSIVHRDRDSQYTSEEVTKYISRTEIRQSFSGKDIPGDNSRSESFFANLEKDVVHWVHCSIRGKTGRIIFASIKGFYNTKRVQKRLGYLSPLEWLHGTGTTRQPLLSVRKSVDDTSNLAR